MREPFSSRPAIRNRATVVFRTRGQSRRGSRPAAPSRDCSIAQQFSLSVVWSEDAGPAHPGRLDLDDDTLTFTGGSRAEPSGLAIPLADLRAVRVGRDARDRLGGRATVLLELHDGRTIAVAAVAAVGALHELADRLSAGLR